MPTRYAPSAVRRSGTLEGALDASQDPLSLSLSRSFFPFLFSTLHMYMRLSHSENV